jgi:hypothetical protein
VTAEGNLPTDFPPNAFELRGFCDACGYSANVPRPRIPAGLSVQGLAQRLRYTACGSSETGIRIIYTGASGFRHGFPALPGHSTEAIREASPAPTDEASLPPEPRQNRTYPSSGPPIL